MAFAVVVPSSNAPVLMVSILSLTVTLPPNTDALSSATVRVLSSVTSSSIFNFPLMVTNPFDNVINSVSFVNPTVVAITFPSRLATRLPVVPVKTSEVFVASVNIVNFPTLSSYPINPSFAESS